MFTGIIQATGSIADKREINNSAHLLFNTEARFLKGVELGDSIAVNGVCLSVTQLKDTMFAADVSPETLACTTFSNLNKGARVHLEKALRLNQGLDGHLVSAHVDGVGEVLATVAQGENSVIQISIPPALCRYVIVKGSITIDGVSLTINRIKDNTIGINAVPHTLAHTHLGALKKGNQVNLEVDMIAKYVAALLANKEELI